MKAQELHRKLVNDDENLEVGKKVIVRWGYGLGFRAEAKGTITKIFKKSVRISLDHDVPHNGGIGWPKGFELKEIPRYSSLNGKWNAWNMFFLCPEQDTFLN